MYGGKVHLATYLISSQWRWWWRGGGSPQQNFNICCWEFEI